LHLQTHAACSHDCMQNWFNSLASRPGFLSANCAQHVQLLKPQARLNSAQPLHLHTCAHDRMQSVQYRDVPHFHTGGVDVCVCVCMCVCVQNMQGLVKVQLQRQLIWLYCAQSLQFWINRETTVNDLCSMVPMLIGTNVSLHLCLAVPEPSPPQHSDACCIVSMMFSCENQQTLQTLHSPNHTWQPTPMNSSRLTVPASASTVASTSRLGLRVGFTPRAAIMSAAVCATTGLGVNLSCRCRS
jgi:hypothetical protein